MWDGPSSEFGQGPGDFRSVEGYREVSYSLVSSLDWADPLAIIPGKRAKCDAPGQGMEIRGTALGREIYLCPNMDIRANASTAEVG